MKQLTFFLSLLAILTLASSVVAQTVRTMPPDSAMVFGPFNFGGSALTVKSVAALDPLIGQAFLSEDKTRLIFVASSNFEEAQTVAIAVTLENDSSQSLSVLVDPAFSAQANSAVGTALAWLVVLTVVAAFIEAAVLLLVAIMRLTIRFFGGKDAMGQDGLKPSVYKPLWAVILSTATVLGFGFDPLGDIAAAFGNDPGYTPIAGLDKYIDVVITILLLAGGAESVRRVATSISGIPNASETELAAEKADAPAG